MNKKRIIFCGVKVERVRIKILLLLFQENREVQLFLPHILGMSQSKVRGTNWSREEIWTLLEAIVKESEVVVRKNINCSVTHEIRTAAWEQIARAVNAIGNSHRTVAQVEKKWADVKSKSILAIHHYRKETTRTGPLVQINIKYFMMSLWNITATWFHTWDICLQKSLFSIF